MEYDIPATREMDTNMMTIAWPTHQRAEQPKLSAPAPAPEPKPSGDISQEILRYVRAIAREFGIDP